jgi:hypothetical protein
MRKIRTLLAGVLLAVPVVAITAGPAAACKQYPCPAACKLNPPVYVYDDAIVFSDRDLVECYY